MNAAENRRSEMFFNKLTTIFIITFLKNLSLCYLFLVLNSTIASALHMLSAKIFHSAKLISIQFLNFRIRRVKGALTLSRDKFCFFPIFWMSYLPEYVTQRRLRIKTWTLCVSFRLISYALLCLLMYHVADTDLFRWYRLCTIFYVSYSLYEYFCIMFCEMRKLPETDLLGKINQLQALSMKGTPLSRLGDQLSEEIEFSSKPTFVQYQYTLYQYLYALDKGDMERVRHLIYKMEKVLPQNPGKSLGSVYNEIIFYYSWLEKDPERAERYKKKAPLRIESDMDLNGRRVYAYYLYGRGADIDKIRNVIDEGLSVADEYLVSGNKSTETNLLLHLREHLED